MFIVIYFSITYQYYVINRLSYNPLPSSIVLHAPYPNPFNPSTSIEYDVPVGMHVNISIYDIRGRLVDELVDEYHKASSASYKITWNALDVSSGIYFVRMNASNNIDKNYNC